MHSFSGYDWKITTFPNKGVIQAVNAVEQTEYNMKRNQKTQADDGTGCSRP
jgi:hypothetical protein